MKTFAKTSTAIFLFLFISKNCFAQAEFKLFTGPSYTSYKIKIEDTYSSDNSLSNTTEFNLGSNNVKLPSI